MTDHFFPIFSIAFAAFTLMSGCSEPPVEALMDAEIVIQIAQAEGAEDYAYDDFRGAADALADAKSKLEAKNFDGAYEAALLAKEKAEQARTNIEAGKQVMKMNLEALKAAIQEAWSALITATEKKKLTVSQTQTLNEIEVLYTNKISDAAARMSIEDYAGARDILEDAKQSLEEANTIIEQN